MTHLLPNDVAAKEQSHVPALDKFGYFRVNAECGHERTGRCRDIDGLRSA